MGRGGIKNTRRKSGKLFKSISNCTETNMEKLNQMTYCDISFNQVETFDVDVEQWSKLVRLVISHNNITRVRLSVWTHKTLVVFEANSNQGLQIPDKIEELLMPSLYLLDVTNNSCLLPRLLGRPELPSIGSLALGGNQLREGHTLVSLACLRS